MLINKYRLSIGLPVMLNGFSLIDRLKVFFSLHTSLCVLLLSYNFMLTFLYSRSLKPIVCLLTWLPSLPIGDLILTLLVSGFWIWSAGSYFIFYLLCLLLLFLSVPRTNN